MQQAAHAEASSKLVAEASKASSKKASSKDLQQAAMQQAANAEASSKLVVKTC
jgi:hypothetical protein